MEVIVFNPSVLRDQLLAREIRKRLALAGVPVVPGRPLYTGQHYAAPASLPPGTYPARDREGRDRWTLVIGDGTADLALTIVDYSGPQAAAVWTPLERVLPGVDTSGFGEFMFMGTVEANAADGTPLAIQRFKHRDGAQGSELVLDAYGQAYRLVDWDDLAVLIDPVEAMKAARPA